MKSSLVLLSGGLDSIINAKAALDNTKLNLILTFDYGQASADREIEAASLFAKKNNISHKIINLTFLNEISDTLKVENIKDFDEKQIDNIKYTQKTARSVWVPNRNGLFINIAASFSEVYKIDYIIVGFNKEEAKTFPDNSKNFIKRINAALKFSTLYKPTVRCYTEKMNKKEIIKYGLKINAPFEFVWSCYRNGNKMCGTCESCQRLKRALKENNFYEKFLEINRWGFEK